MDAKVKAEWLAALRSGEYVQGYGYLKTDAGYCCLGVLCDLAVKAKVIPGPQQNEDGESYDYGEEFEDNVFLPQEVQNWAGLDPNPGSDDADRPCLSVMNDEHYTFGDIAEQIEQFF